MRELLLDKIKPNPHQPRKYFDEKAQEILKETLGKQILPILVIPGGIPDIPRDIDIGEDEYLIIDGERRWRACKDLGRKTMICEILEDTSYTEAYDNAGIIHRTTATHDPQARAWLIVESILNHLGGELETYGWSRDWKGVLSCGDYIHHIRKRGNSKNLGQEFLAKFGELCNRHGWEVGTLPQRLREDLQIPDDLLDTIQDGTMAHQTATEFIKVTDKAIREKVIKKIKQKPIARREAQKIAAILVDEEVPEKIKDKILDVKEDVDLDYEKEKVAAIKEIRRDEEFTEQEKQEIEQKIVKEEREAPASILARERFKKVQKPQKLAGLSPFEFVNALSADLGKTVNNFKLLEPVWEYISESQKRGLQVHINELLEIWSKLKLITKGGIREQSKEKKEIIQISPSS